MSTALPRLRETRISSRERFVLLAGLVFVIATLLAGPFRMYLSLAGATPLVYLPNLMLLMATGWQFAAEPAEKGFSPMRLIAIVVPCFGMIVGLQFVSPMQVAMGSYVLLPFAFGITCRPVFERHWAVVAPAIPWLWLVAVCGVVLNLGVEYPWEGFGYAVRNLEVEGSRQWYANGGIKRLAGFARASFDAAVQIQFTAILLAVRLRNSWLRAILWAVTIGAILPTNSKGILFVAIVLAPIVILGRALPQSPLRALPAVFGLVGLALPLSTLLFSFDSPLRDPTLASVTNSFFERLNTMWPEAWVLLHEQGSLLLGRGIGGIGTAQTYFEPALFNAGDNLFMYWLVIFGWAALPGFVLLLLRSIGIRPHRDPAEFRIYCLLLAILVYGSIANIVENAVTALICGIVVRHLCEKPGAISARIPAKPRVPLATAPLTQGESHA